MTLTILCTRPPHNNAVFSEDIKHGVHLHIRWATESRCSSKCHCERAGSSNSRRGATKPRPPGRELDTAATSDRWPQRDRRPLCRYLWRVWVDSVSCVSPILSSYKVLMSTKPGVSDCKQARRNHGEGLRPGETEEERCRRITDARRRRANNSTFTPKACCLCEMPYAVYRSRTGLSRHTELVHGYWYWKSNQRRKLLIQ